MRRSSPARPSTEALFLPVASCLVACAGSSIERAPEPPPPLEKPTLTEAAVENLEREHVVERHGFTDEELAAFRWPYEMIEGEPMFTLLEEDGIPAIDEPTFVSADEALEWMDLDETVLGVVGADGTAKCYSAWQLDNHEIVNDELDGHAIAATW